MDISADLPANMPQSFRSGSGLNDKVALSTDHIAFQPQRRFAKRQRYSAFHIRIRHL
jgi:hypothetical protein